MAVQKKIYSASPKIIEMGKREGRKKEEREKEKERAKSSIP